MFVDSTEIYVKAGNGGNGAVAFHREKYVAAGGPDGGDGGRGGNIIIQVNRHLNTLADIRFRHRFVAEDGENGKGDKMFGKSGSDLTIKVPLGTLIKDPESGLVIKDMSDDEPFILAKGGKGGWGNRHFATATRQCPRFARSGQDGEERTVILELKLIADVGLVGFPNVGKSSLLSVVSSAKPKIANYHFTTLVPNLGVVGNDGESSFVMADIPGIIEGASEGAGLGHDFLRHVERCRMLVHVVDVSGSEGRDPIEDYEKLNLELKSFSEKLAGCPQIVAANKIDAVYDPEITERFKNYIVSKNIPYYEISAVAHMGLQELIAGIQKMLADLPPVTIYESEYVEAPVETYNNTDITIEKHGDICFVEGKWLLKIMRCIDFNDEESLQYFQRVLRMTGVIDKLVEAGVKENDTVCIYDYEFDFVI